MVVEKMKKLHLEIRTKCPTPTANDMNCCGYMVMWYKIFYERKMAQFGFLFLIKSNTEIMNPFYDH